MPALSKPWRNSNNLIKKDEPCTHGKPHRLRMISLTRTDSSEVSVPNGHMKSEVIYQCVVCKKYQIDRYVYPKMERALA